LVEQRTENPRVGGSIPPLGTSNFNDLTINFMSVPSADTARYFLMISMVKKC
jgi:hypothetical protein